MNTANIHGVKTFILSLGHAQASLLEGQEEEILGPEFIPDIVFDHLPRTRKEYRRVVLGVGRCFKRLRQLAWEKRIHARDQEAYLVSMLSDALSYIPFHLSVSLEIMTF